MAQDRFDTIVGANVTIQGNLSNQGSIEIHGKVEGEINSDQDILVGESAEINGPVKAKNLDISGVISGSIMATEKLELQPTGQIHGDITTEILSIKPGATFNGTCKMSFDKNDKSRQIKKEPEIEVD